MTSPSIQSTVDVVWWQNSVSSSHRCFVGQNLLVSMFNYLIQKEIASMYSFFRPLRWIKDIQIFLRSKMRVRQKDCMTLKCTESIIAWLFSFGHWFSLLFTKAWSTDRLTDRETVGICFSHLKQDQVANNAFSSVFKSTVKQTDRWTVEQVDRLTNALVMHNCQF